ncbi:hypothetical protein IAR55_007190 [Kwoniella newhampshirensis]|uniref:Cutinase n=1 Tax=Kwoniella newhampshirensis TaxID=1651941 RepID=A0AAW0YTK2_9TREE
MFGQLVVLVFSLVLTGAIPVERATSSNCPSYTIISTRGTGEAQGPSAGFTTMNRAIMSDITGGKIYNTVYPAGSNQDSSAGTRDIIAKVNSALQTNPNECFILQGYSQGAAATVNALPSITGAAFTAVKGVFLIGDPLHKSGLSCNVDNNNGTTTRNVNGLSAGYGSRGIPTNWISKSLDVCIYGDGVCDTTHGYGINSQHLQYSRDSPTQRLGESFAVSKLR